MKKLISLIGAGALLLSVAGPAFGAFTINKANVWNTTMVVADTGSNSVGNGVSVLKAGVDGNVNVSGDNAVTTGNAKAKNFGVIAVNTSVGCCPEPCDTCQESCNLCQGSSLTVNKANVWNTTMVVADTGSNSVGNGVSVEKAGVDGNVNVSGANSVVTGNAKAKNVGVILVNTQVSFGMW